MKKRYLLLLLILIVFVLPFFVWVFWSETNREQERSLRLTAYEQIHKQFPEAMSLDNDQWYGLHAVNKPQQSKAHIILLHGLDDPGTIWDDLAPRLSAENYALWRFNYPNDHAIALSADYFNRYWQTLQLDKPVFLIGHSMGGLVIRDFVTRHYASKQSSSPVAGVILVGTPNKGSELSRFRAFLEVYDQLPIHDKNNGDLFSGLRDGTGAAKVDLLPGSRFLTELNKRAWPENIAIHIIMGKLLDLNDMIGDGVVNVESAGLPELVAHPDIVDATHRGLLKRQPLIQENEPPAIALIIKTLEEWLNENGGVNQ